MKDLDKRNKSKQQQSKQKQKQTSKQKYRDKLTIGKKTYKKNPVPDRK